MTHRNAAPAVDLSGTWELVFSDDAAIFASPETVEAAGLTLYPATVPGNFELDLHAAGLIPEPFVGMNIAALPRWERTHAWYTCTFTAPPLPADHDALLLCDGLDLDATVWLNGEWLGDAQNALVPHSFPIAPEELHFATPNTLQIHLSAPEISDDDAPPLLFTQANRYDALRARRAPHAYGWDIMPRAVSKGIWRPIRLVYVPKERLETVFLDTLSIAGSARLALHVTARVDGPFYGDTTYEIAIEGRCADSRFAQRTRILHSAARLNVAVPQPRLWWPRGRGDANLYEVTVRLFKNGVELDQTTFAHGIRTVELVRTSVTDETGAGEFLFKVNGERLFIHGSNWVPVDAYHSRDRARIPRILELAADLNCNMLRCWGGNVYEDDLFYDTCDREGILIWQDFALACAVYPLDTEFQRTLADEARAVVRRLRQHPCIALWAGDNECDQAWSWGGRRQDPNRNVLTRRVLPDILLEEDPSRPYLPSSPYIDDVAFARGEKYLPENHLWGPRDYYKSRYYTESLCHFASEIGYHGCPSPESLAQFLSPEKLWPPTGNDEWTLHSTSPVPGIDLYDYRVQLMADQIRELFGTVPDNLDDFAFASQVSQAEAKKFFVELFRASAWRRTGILWWNLMDGWPQMSDAIVDYTFAKKLAYGYLWRAQRPLTLILREPQSWGQELVASSNYREDTPLSFSIRDIESGERILAGDATARADSVTALGRIPYSASWKRLYRIAWTGPAGTDGFSHYLCGNPPFDLETYRRWGRAAGLFS
jgi:beta-mannosidase